MAGTFPTNTGHQGRQPYFIDPFNVYCAAGYLIKESGFDAVAREISRTQNFSYLLDIQHPELMNWVNQSGLGFDELELIQPGYLGQWPASIIEMHYNNTGVDVDEYIEIHQNTEVMNNGFTQVVLLDSNGTVYKTLPIAQMQSLSGVYYYLFPASESFADKGKILIQGFSYTNVMRTLQEITYDGQTVTIVDSIQIGSARTKIYSTGENESTPLNTSLSFCGSFYSEDFSLQSIAATVGSINPCTVVPLTFGNFSYALKGRQVELQWQTLSELNTHDFSIERSSDGIYFVSIGTIPAAGNSSTTHQYRFLDKAPLYLNQYRIRQSDKDGKIAYTNILYVKADRASIVSLNSTVVNSTLTYTLASRTTTSVDIYDMTGKKLSSNMAVAGQHTVNVGSWPAGTYLLRATAEGQVYSTEFVKQ